MDWLKIAKPGRQTLPVEDTTGKGHRDRVIGTEEVLVVIVTLPEETASA